MDLFDSGDHYEVFMGRWSRLVAQEFVGALAVPPGLRWLDVGCGTGALAETILDHAAPAMVTAVDPSPEFAEVARSRLGARADVRVASGDELPFADDSFDLVVSGLALNFIPDPIAALREWLRVVTAGGSIAAYVWDYAEGMEFLRIFWDMAVEMDPSSQHLDEAVRFPICHPARLADLFDRASLSSVDVGRIDVPTVFADFDDYWDPFLRGQGPAPGYVASLPYGNKDRLERRLRSAMPRSPDGTITLAARAWSVTGRR